MLSVSSEASKLKDDQKLVLHLHSPPLQILLGLMLHFSSGLCSLSILTVS